MNPKIHRTNMNKFINVGRSGILNTNPKIKKKTATIPDKTKSPKLCLMWKLANSFFFSLFITKAIISPNKVI